MSAATLVKQKLPWYLLAVAIVALGMAGFRVMGAMKTPVEASPAKRSIPTAQVIDAVALNQPLAIRSQGFVKPFREIELASQVAGQIQWMHPAIESQGRFKQGDVLVRLDDRAAQANLASTQAALDLVSMQTRRAQQLQKDGTLSQDQVDQLTSQQIQLQSALKSAQIALENTRITAPFDGRVAQALARLGSIVNPAQPMARIYTDQQLEVTVSLLPSEAALIPSLFAEPADISAQITSQFGSANHSWQGQVSRARPALDPATRTLDVTIAIQQQANPPFELLTQSLVQVAILAPGLDLMEIPASALRKGEQVWLVKQDELQPLAIDVVYSDQDRLFVRAHDALSQYPVLISALEGARAGLQVNVVDNAQ